MRISRMAIAVALGAFALHLLTNGQYGFHRDELATLDDARRLAWGYVAYPPMTPFFGRLSLALFGLSVGGARFFPALTQSAVILLAALIARDFGGGRRAQAIAAAAVAIAPVALIAGALLQYVAFDYLCWMLTAWCVARLLRSGDPRWWLGIGAGVGAGMMAKYSMAFLVAGIAGGCLLTPARRYLRSHWLWLGAVLAVLIVLPNLLWQARHDFVSLEFLRSIHARDVRIGRTSGFLPEQLYVPACLLTVPLWVTGAVWLFRGKEGRPFRMMGWMVAIPFLLFVIAQGRSYYTAPAISILLAAGATWWERRLAAMPPARERISNAAGWFTLAAGAACSILIAIPLAPVNSTVWKMADSITSNWREQIGWPDLVARVAAIRDGLPAAERASAGILASNYGEAGAIDLYGPAYGLPHAISGTNSYWFRGFGESPPRTLIVLGLSRSFVGRTFGACTLAGRNGNSFGVRNEESEDHPDIFICRDLPMGWPAFWRRFRSFS
jgi:4-amino-4-deoxy-L-arabinose transferase-like glycosyltransferase